MEKNKDTSVEELLKDRYMVNTPWPPSNNYQKGDIVTPDMFTGWHPKEYPIIFTELEWYQERSVEDMPGYVKEEDTGIIRRFKQWHNEYEIQLFDNPGEWEYDERVYAERDGKSYEIYPVIDLSPATEQEYLNFINTKQ